MIKTITLSFLLLFSLTGYSQLAVTPRGTPQQIVSAFVAAGLNVSNVTISCGATQYGTFNGSASNIGLQNGVLLTSGSATLAQGPNNAGGDGYCWSTGPMPADSDLIIVEPLAVYDKCVLEFDLVPNCSELTIRFVFASEEYPEYVFLSVSDAFGIFVTGPAPDCSSPGYEAQNVAVLPNGTAVEIDSINNGYWGGCPSDQTSGPCTNCAFYVNNCGGATVEYDGFTVPINYSLTVCPCASYHWKFIIADAGDCVWDSGVFIEFLQCSSPAFTYTVNTVDATCTCNGSASVNITSGTPPYTYSWLPSGQSTATATGLCAGTHTVSVTDSNSCTVPVIQTFTIDSNDLVLNNISIDASCSSCCDGSITTTVSGGNPPYTYTMSCGPSTNVCPGTYICCVVDSSGCSACDTIVIDYPSGIDEISNDEIHIHPNPAHNTLSISLNEELKMQNAELRIFDITGRAVHEQTLNHKSEIITHKFSPGIYFVKVRAAEGSSWRGEKVLTEKLVVE
jgi:hypothetical protein